jgi:hypothetical protein
VAVAHETQDRIASVDNILSDIGHEADTGAAEE